MSISKGDIVCESTLYGDREIVVATEPDKRGYYQGWIISGPDATSWPSLYCFNVIEARYARKPNPGEMSGLLLIA